MTHTDSDFEAVHESISEDLDPLPVIDRLGQERQRLTLRRTNAVYLGVISLIITIGFAGWGPRFLPQVWMPFAGAAVSGAMVIAALVATAVLVTRERRAGREYRKTVEAMDLTASSHTPPPAGVMVGRQLVLVSDDQTLHAAVVQSVPFQIAKRAACLLLAIAIAAAFTYGLIRFGARLHGISNGPVNFKGLLVFWAMPFASFALIVIALSTRPVQWYASAQERSLTIEKLSKIGQRSVVTIPGPEIDSFELWMDDMYVVTTGGERHSLLGFPEHKPIPGLKDALSKQMHATQLKWRSGRVAAGVMLLVTGRPDHTLRVGVANMKQTGRPAPAPDA
jgi:hypothetical protein